MKPQYVISACLCGMPTRYDGRSKPVSPSVQALIDSGAVIPVCPECMGGLPTPRPPSEIQGDRVINTEGVDVTAEYRSGAEQTLAICLEHGIRHAILKENSPSCGCRFVYDGTFSKQLIPGRGITAALLEQHGITVENEENWK